MVRPYCSQTCPRPAAGGVVKRDDMELLFREQAEKEEGRKPDGGGQSPPPPAPAPFQLHPSPKIRRMCSDPLQELLDLLGRSPLRLPAPVPQLPQHDGVGAVTVTGWCQLRVASSFLL